jgi:hypothetical protein
MPSDYKPTKFANAIWNALIERVQNNDLPVTYGELSMSFYGKKTSQSFKHAGNIHENTLKFNELNKLKIKEQVPSLNLLIVQKDKDFSGPGAPGFITGWREILGQIERIGGISRLREVGRSIGYDPNVGWERFQPTAENSSAIEKLPVDNINNRRAAISTGPCIGGERVTTIWSAKHSPIVKTLSKQLNARGWTICSERCQTIPDLVVEKKLGGKIRRIMLEIKPDYQTHNLLCALGQSVLYREDWRADRAIVIALSDKRVECSDLILKTFKSLRVEIIRASHSRGEPFSFSDFYFHFEHDDELL